MTDEGQEFHPSTRIYKETRLGQHALVVWLYGLSGAGKTTLANAMETRLAAEGILTKTLDGDDLRKGLNRNLGFDDDSRTENIRRSAEAARLLLDCGIVTIAAFICPKREMREMARQIVGEEDFFEVFVKASYEACSKRDVKGLYAKAARGDVPQFTGKDSTFEEPEAISSAIVLETERHGIARCTERVLDVILPRIRSHKPV